MAEQITTSAELDVLPVGSVVMCLDDPLPYERVFEKQEVDGAIHWYSTGSGQPYSWWDFHRSRLPLTVLYRPDQQPTAQPTVEAVNEALLTVWHTSTAAQLTDSPEGHVGRFTEAVLALLPGRPESEARVDLIDHLIDRYYKADKNHFLLPSNVIDWLRSQPEYTSRYGIEAEADHV